MLKRFATLRESEKTCHESEILAIIPALCEFFNAEVLEERAEFHAEGTKYVVPLVWIYIVFNESL